MTRNNALAPLLFAGASILLAGCRHAAPESEALDQPAAPAPPPETITQIRVVERDPAVVETWPNLLTTPPDGAPEADGLDGEEVAALLDHVIESGLLEDSQFEKRARERLQLELAELLLDDAEARARPVNEQAVRDAYEARRQEFALPERVTVRLIVVSTQSEADAILGRARSGEDFMALAREKSQHPSRIDGGDLPPFSRGAYAAPVEDLAFSLSPGEVGSVQTGRGVFIIQKVAQSEASVQPYESVAPQLRAELEAQVRREARQRFLRSVMNGN